MIKTIMALVLPVLVSHSLFACLVEKPLTEEIKNQAYLVFVGKPIAYTPRPKFDLKNKAPWKPAIIRFKVEKIISGPKTNEIDVYWINSTFGESKSLLGFILTYGYHTRVGIQYANNSAESMHFKDKPWVVQGSCTKPYMWSEQ